MSYLKNDNRKVDLILIIILKIKIIYLSLRQIIKKNEIYTQTYSSPSS